jgi:hypothetical protein
MEFPTEWTMPDPAEDRDHQLLEQGSGPQPPQPATAMDETGVPLPYGRAGRPAGSD